MSLIAAIVFGGLSAVPAPASAEEPVLVGSAPDQPVLVWSPRWSRADTVDYLIIGGAASVALATAIIPPISKNATGGVLLDDSARDTLRLPSLTARYWIRDASDVLISLLVTYPFFVDSLITVSWAKRSTDVAFQMAVIDVEAMAITGAIQGLANTIASRERPYARDCGGRLPNEVNDCDSPARYRSFFSGHAALAFTSASLLCVQHQRLQLLGDAGDTATCTVAYLAAAATATFRVMSDMHYATDVLAGAAVGTVVGYLVPALHYGFSNNDSTPAADIRLIPTSNGLAIMGTY